MTPITDADRRMAEAAGRTAVEILRRLKPRVWRHLGPAAEVAYVTWLARWAAHWARPRPRAWKARRAHL